MKPVKICTAAALVSLFATHAGLNWWDNRRPDLTPAGEEARTEILGRLAKQRYDGQPTQSDQCAAYYLAVRGDNLAAENKTAEAEQEILVVIDIFYSCEQGQKPQLL